MNRLRTHWTVPVLLALLVSAIPVIAQGIPADAPHPPRPPMPPLPGGPPDPALGPAGLALRAVDLATDQREQIHEIARGYMEGELGFALRAVHEARRELELLVWDTNAGEAEIDARSATVAERARELEQVRHRLGVAVIGVLDPEQQQAFATALREGPPRPECDEGPGRPRGGPGSGFGRPSH